MSSSVTESIRAGKITPLQIVIIASCVFMNAIDGVDVLAISFAGPSISQEWGMSPIALGIVYSAGLIGMAAGALVLGPVGDYIGRRPATLLNLVIMTVGMFATAYVSTIPGLMFWRIFTGLGIGGILASINTMVAEFAPEKYKNFALSCMHVGYPAGAVITSPIAAWLLSEFGWHSIFIGGALLSGVMIFVVFFWVPESIDYYLLKRPKNALQEINKILVKLNQPPLDKLPEPESPAVKEGGGGKTAVIEIVTGKYLVPTLLLWISFFCTFLALYFVLNWVPKLIVNYGFTPGDGIYGNFWINLGGIFGGLTLGYVSAIFGLRVMTRIHLLLGAVGLVLFGLAGPDLGLIYGACVVIGFALLGVISGLYTTSARLYPVKTRNSGVGLAIGMGRVGAIIGPSLAGFLIEAGWTTSMNFYFFAAPLVIAAAIFFYLHYDDPKTIVVNWPWSKKQ